MSFTDFVHKLLARGVSPSDDIIDFSEKRKHSRVDVDFSDPLKIHLMSELLDGTAKTLMADVRNVSLRGCLAFFRNNQDVQLLTPEQALNASLNIEGFSIPLRVGVIRVCGPQEVALRFKPPFPRELEKLEKFLEPRCLGLSLREIRSDSLQKEPQSPTRWFQGVNETNFFIWMDETTQTIQKAQLIFLNCVVQWQKNEKVITGQIGEVASSSEKRRWASSERLMLDRELNTEVYQAAQNVLEHAKLDHDLKDFMKGFL